MINKFNKLFIIKILIFLFLNLLIINLINGQCTLSLDAGASGCYWNGTSSKTKIVVEVSWTNAPIGDSIIVTGPPGSSPATRVIKTGTIQVQYVNHAVPPITYATANQTIVSPQLVTFEIDANGATGLTVSAQFANNSSCNAVSNPFSSPASCMPLQCTNGQLGGHVFFDYNADGILQSDEEEAGVANIKITVIDRLGNIDSTRTVKYGRWTLNIPSANYPVRVEFSALPGYARQGTPYGLDGNTTTQFISAPSCNVDLGILNNESYTSQNPKIFLTQMPSGDPLRTDGNTKDVPALLMVDYDAQGAKNLSKMQTIVTSEEIGCTWGLAHNKYTNRLFVSAFVRRHSGLGPKGIGGLYVINPNTGVVDSWDVDADFGINVGSIADNSTRGLNKDVSGSSVDGDGFLNTLKIGIGDIDISENGNQLYLVNLFDKKIYRIDLTAYNTSGTKPTSANVTSWSFPDPGCVGGQSRPFGLKWYGNYVYLGVVCDAQTSDDKSNLRAFLYRLNPVNSNWTTMFDFPLTYPKGFPNKDIRDITGWYPWTEDWSKIDQNLNLIAEYPQPIFSDIEFDVDGSLILAFADRAAFQTGYKNKAYPDDGKLYYGFVGGDILRAFNNGSGRFVLENNAMAGPNMGYAPGNNQGPGFGEYYNDDWIGDKGNLNHAECVLGSLALAPGSGKVIVSTIDPVDSINWAGGFRVYDNATGLRNQAYTVYETDNTDPGTFAKSGALGDIELLLELPTFIEVGNRVWIDTDKDGVQGPDENPLSGVKVAIYKSGIKIAETITNSTGEYYFSDKNANDPNLTWIGTGVDTTLLPSISYQLVFGETQFASNKLTISGIDYQLTTANSTSGTGNDQNDSDATIITNFPRININSPVEGAVNHTYDVGFWLAPTCTLTATCTSTPQTKCSPANGTATVTPSGVQGNLTYLWSNGGTTATITGLTAATYTVTVTDDIITNCTTTCSVTVTNTTTPPSVTCSKVDNTNCTTPNGSATATAIGVTYLWSNGGTTAIISGLSAGTYTVTVTSTTTGCTNTCSAIVTNTSTPPTVTCSKVDNTNCSTPNGSATATATGVTYLWSNGGTTATITGLNGGTYTVTVTSTTNGCTATCSATVVNNTTNPTANCTPTANTSCTTPNGQATVSTNASSPTYIWSNGATTATITGLNAGTYTVTVTNTVTSCTNTCSAIVTNTTTPPTVTCAKVDNTNCSTPNGSATANATGVTYLWSNGGTTATITGLNGGTYTVTVTSTTNGCTATCSAMVVNNTTNPTANCTPTANTSCTTPNGQATVSTNASSPTYIWSTGATTATITGLNAGTYTVTVTNTVTSCTNICSAIVTNTTTPPTVTCSKVDNTNCSTPNGSATATATGVTYLWSNGGTTATITGLNGGTYTVTVTSTTNGCTATCSATVSNTSTPPTVTCAKVDNTNCGTPNGSSTATASGVTYLWSNGGTTSTISNLSAATYTVTVTSTVTGCTNTCSATVLNNTTNPTANCTPTSNTNCVSPNGQATVSTNASSPTYIWSNGGATAIITGLNAGTYTVTVTNTVTSCTNTCSAIVTNTTTPPTVTCSKVDNTNCSTPNGSATATATGVTYLWSNGGTTVTISNLSAATYTVTVTSTATGCTNTCSVTVANSLTPPTVTCTPVQPTCASPNGGSVTASGSGGTGTLTYTWSNGSSGVNITGLGAGIYTVTVTDGNNCTSSCSSTLNAPTGCCEINDLGLIIGNCDNKGTLTNANDDEYTFTLDPTGTGIGSTYTVNGLPNSPQTGTYGSPTTFGPYLISAGVLNISVVDNVSNTCSKTASVTPPPSCSVCNVNPPVLSVNDNICPSRTGSINLVQGCGAGTFIQYSTNNGASWSTVKPLYSTTPLTILARCVNSIDTTCKSPNATVTTAPKKCPNSGNECTLSANATIDPCNNNGTDNIASDDYFTIQVNATVANGGSNNKYEVVIGADPLTGIGGNVLNSGGTNYGSPVTVGNTKIFKADGTSTYQLVIRDINNNNCFQIIDIQSVIPCSIAPPKSPCYPVPCVPIGLIKN